MKTENQWLNEYQKTHQHPANKKIHMVCVPAIFWSVTAILWALPTPEIFGQIPLLNWATLISFLALIFYASLGLGAFIKMAAVIAIALFVDNSIASTRAELLLSSAICIFIVAWIGQFYGHKLEGKKPAFFEDILFLLIGPLWTLSKRSR